MKKFLEELRNVDVLSFDNMAPVSTENTNLRDMEKYSKLVGRRGLYLNKTTKDSRPITVLKAYKHFVTLKYNNYSEQGLGYPGTISVAYTSLRCGDESIIFREGDR